MTSSIKLLTKENRDTRRANLLLLLNESGDKKQELAAKANTKPAYIGHILTTDLSRRREIGDRLARKLEKAYGKPEGWMDQKHDQPLLTYQQYESLAVEIGLSVDELAGLSLDAFRKALKSTGIQITNEERKHLYEFALKIGLEGVVTEGQFKVILYELFPDRSF